MPMKAILQFSIMIFALAVVVFSVSAQYASALPVNKCSRVIRNQVGSETLINRCDKCMKIKVERRRPGNIGAAPTMRDYTMPRGSSQPLPFKGPGGTRIISEFPCKG